MGTAADFLLRLVANQASTGDYSGGPRAEVLSDVRLSLGTGDNQFAAFYHDERTLSGSATEDLDMTSILDGNGSALGAAEVTLIILQAAAGNTGNIELKPGSTNGWTSLLKDATDTIAVKPGEFFAASGFQDGSLAVGATNKVLTLTNSAAGTATYTLTILARAS